MRNKLAGDAERDWRRGKRNDSIPSVLRASNLISFLIVVTQSIDFSSQIHTNYYIKEDIGKEDYTCDVISRIFTRLQNTQWFYEDRNSR